MTHNSQSTKATNKQDALKVLNQQKELIAKDAEKFSQKVNTHLK